MKTFKTEDLKNFEFWSGGEWANKYLTDEEFDEIEFQLEELYPDGVDETTINDLFWHDTDYVLSLIGTDYDTISER